jgi:hypothetical protein
MLLIASPDQPRPEFDVFIEPPPTQQRSIGEAFYEHSGNTKTSTAATCTRLILIGNEDKGETNSTSSTVNLMTCAITRNEEGGIVTRGALNIRRAFILNVRVTS